MPKRLTTSTPDDRNAVERALAEVVDTVLPLMEAMIRERSMVDIESDSCFLIDMPVHRRALRLLADRGRVKIGRRSRQGIRYRWIGAKP